MVYLRDEHVDRQINGLSRRQMKTIFKELGLDITDYPLYSGGDIFCAKKDFIDELVKEFPVLWQDLLARHESGREKFNEEGHMFSYYYYLFNSDMGGLNLYIKRIWTNPLFYRDVESTDKDLTILHVPAEKEVGISDMFKQISKGKHLYEITEDEYQKMILKLFSPWKHYKKVPERIWRKLSKRQLSN